MFFSIVTPVFSALTQKSLTVQQDAPEAEYLHGVNRAEVMQQATGRYLWFMQPGDCLPDAFALRDIARELQSAFMPDLAYGDARLGGRIHKAKDADRLTHGMVAQPGAVLYNRVFLASLPPVRDYGGSEDYALLLRGVLQTGRIHIIDRLVCDCMNEALSHDERKQKREREMRIRADLLRMPPWQNRLIDWEHRLFDKFQK